MAEKPRGDKAKTAAGGRKGEKEQGRKDKVLQARVSESLYNDLVDQAGRLRVPVSNLVRNILEDSMRMLGNILDGGIKIAEALGPRVSDQELESVIGWQPMMANKSMACRRCRTEIKKGSEAFISVGAPAGRAIVICKECKCGM